MGVVERCKDGFSAAMCFTLYAVIRSIVTLTRGDDLYLGPIRAPHIASAIMIIVFGLFIWRGKLHQRTKLAR
ncbi:MAG: hypothetical protein ABFD77_06155 [Thermotogota bacterium]